MMDDDANTNKMKPRMMRKSQEWVVKPQQWIKQSESKGQMIPRKKSQEWMMPRIPQE